MGSTKLHLGDSGSWASSTLATLSVNGDLLRSPLAWIEGDDFIRPTILAEIVWPATGDAVTTVPGAGVGGGDALPLRNSGWMWFSLGVHCFADTCFAGSVFGDGAVGRDGLGDDG